MSMAEYKMQPIAVPPLPEQARIVVKVDQLMALCDVLEEKQTKKRETRVRLNAACLDRLTTAKSPKHFAKHWTRICDHFELLYEVPETVEQLRQAILQLAVMGKLVPQDPRDEPVSKLVSQIESLRKRLVIEKAIPNYQPHEGLDASELVRHAPSTWNWIQLGSIISLMDSGWSPKCHDHPSSPENWGVLRTTAVQQMRYDATQHKALPEKLKPRPKYEVMPGDLLITRAGPRQRVGISCIVEETPERLMISDKIIRFHLLGDKVLPAFFILCLNAGISRDFLDHQKSGMAVSQMNIPQAKLRLTPIPIAPTNEQRRIVERVYKLRTLCADLEVKLKQSEEQSEKLMEAVVQELVNGSPDREI